MSGFYKYRTNQYSGPILDPMLYREDFLFEKGRIRQDPNVQWVQDPSTLGTAERVRLSNRLGDVQECDGAFARILCPKMALAAISYRPYD